MNRSTALYKNPQLNSTTKGYKVFITLMLLIFSALSACSQLDKPQAPEAIFTTLTGKKIALLELQNKPVLITFWATSCPSCVAEIPHLIDLYNRYHAQGLEVIGIAMFYDIPSRVVGMYQAKKLPYDIVLDVQAIHARQFGDIQLTPTTLLISPDKKIIWSTVGSFDVTAMNKRIETLLKG